MKLGDDTYHKRLRKFEPYDKVTIEQVPRFKTSGLSGDEWRTGTVVQLWFKGVMIVEEFYNSYDYAIANLTALIADKSCPIEQKVIDIEEKSCDQPGCSAPAVSKFRLKAEFSDSGEKLDMSDQSFRHYRQFCQRHLERGDCSREDCDSNYEVISGPGPNEAHRRPEDESPSRCVVVNADSIEDVPRAVHEAMTRER
jgi:hypothetical protein